MGYEQALQALSIISFLSLIPPLVWNIKCRNAPAIVLVVWLLLLLIKEVVDASVWSGEDFAERWDGRIWCDIMVKIQVGSNIGILTSITAVCLNLYIILCANNLTIMWFASAKRKLFIELLITLIFPFCIMGLNYIVQNIRYIILRYAGCEISTTDSWVVVVLYSMWMVIFSLIAFILALLTIIKYFRRRKDVKDILNCTNSGLSLRRFARLLIFCILIILVMFPISLYYFCSEVTSIVGGYSWDEVHDPSTWDLVVFIDEPSPLFDRWIYIFVSLFCFLIFGSGEDAFLMYRDWLTAIGFGPLISKYEYFKKRKTQGDFDSFKEETNNNIYQLNDVEAFTGTSSLQKYDSMTKDDDDAILMKMSDLNYKIPQSASTSETADTYYLRNDSIISDEEQEFQKKKNTVTVTNTAISNNENEDDLSLDNSDEYYIQQFFKENNIDPKNSENEQLSSDINLKITYFTKQQKRLATEDEDKEKN
ncbi:hypothetical protein PACTADRAFT_47921 [Pachysolen tannophilus NRRL Y-2460]|uniref:Pheromone a factor receptor n=1 Tax=Pachysolen tannophilus NRRL Y-2460 TaxID=669874 RepID=A0A1E4U278_PACTA|nr:hypothetical protein PACTADRAFT_47921 [Pachysolen tannophilus NRRL Y-2460]